MGTKKKAVPFVGMVLVEVAQVGLMIISKQVMREGMSSLVFVLYSNALASLILLPSSLLFHFHRYFVPSLLISHISNFYFDQRTYVS